MVKMAKKRLKKLFGTNGADELIGTKRMKRIYGRGGNDIISTPEGRFNVWGGDEADTFKTLNGGKGYMKIMDFEAGDTVTFCGCPSTRIEQRGKDAWIVKADDVKAVLKGIDAEDLEIDFDKAEIKMNAASLKKLRGTEGADELTGTRVKRLVYGLGGDDVIATEEGKYRVWGGEDDDTFKTLNGGKGYMKIMDFEAGDTITFCGCASTRIEQRGKDAWIVKADDVKAVLKGIDADDLDIDFTKAVITMSADPLA